VPDEQRRAEFSFQIGDRAEIEGCEMKQRLAAAVRLRSLNTAAK
jgi:hypothetical protein